MKALTICQPYAELIANGSKPIENRTWPTSYRGPLAIHAGKSRAWLDDEDDEPSGMVFGAVIAVVELYACVKEEDLPLSLTTNEHANGPWCWLLRDVRRVTPVPYRGAQGLWILPSDLKLNRLSGAAPHAEKEQAIDDAAMDRALDDAFARTKPIQDAEREASNVGDIMNMRLDSKAAPEPGA